MRTLFLLLAVSALRAASANVNDIVSRSAAAMDRNWRAAPHYTFVERDIETKHGGKPTVKTYRVFVIEGSPYNRLIAIGDKRLSRQEETRETQKLQVEMARRKRENSVERTKRVAKYTRERQQDHVMMQEMVHAFDFHLIGEQKVNGRDCWVLDATARLGYEPATREARILAGMQGKLWVDQRDYQWIQVTAEVTHPVSMFLVARVSPGTRFMLEQAPVGDGVWLPKRFKINVVATALGFINENSSDDETYSHYLPMPSETQMLALGPLP